MKTHGGVEVQTQTFLAPKVNGGDGQLHTLASLTQGKDSPIPNGPEVW
jgi:hypothetical protein